MEEASAPGRMPEDIRSEGLQVAAGPSDRDAMRDRVRKGGWRLLQQT